MSNQAPCGQLNPTVSHQQGRRSYHAPKYVYVVEEGVKIGTPTWVNATALNSLLVYDLEWRQVGHRYYHTEEAARQAVDQMWHFNDMRVRAKVLLRSPISDDVGKWRQRLQLHALSDWLGTLHTPMQTEADIGWDVI
jgi:hypothetical protein